MRCLALLALGALLCAALVHGQGFSVEEQVNRTGFLSIVCDQENDAYLFSVNNNLALAMSFRVDLRCKNNDARNSVQLPTLAPFSRTSQLTTIKPATGTVRNQECTLALVGKDVYQLKSASPDAELKYAERSRLCGRSIFDGAFDDDDDGCDYWVDCIGTRNWWHNGLVYVLAHVLALAAAFMLVLVIGANRQLKLNDVADNYNVAGKNPRDLFLRIRDNLENMVENDLQRERVVSAVAYDPNARVSGVLGGDAFADDYDSVATEDRDAFLRRHRVSEEYMRKIGAGYMDLLLSGETGTAHAGGRLDFMAMHGGATFSRPIGYKDGSVGPVYEDEDIYGRIEADVPADMAFQSPLRHGGASMHTERVQPDTVSHGDAYTSVHDVEPLQENSSAIRVGDDSALVHGGSDMTELRLRSTNHSTRVSGYSANSTVDVPFPHVTEAGGVV